MATPTNPYTSQAISGFNQNPPEDTGVKTDSNRIEWGKHLSKLANPLRTLAEAINSAVTGAFNLVVVTTDAAEEDLIVTFEEFS